VPAQQWFADYDSAPKKDIWRHLVSEKFEAVYDYTDENGKILYQVCRKRTAEGKTFIQRRPDGSGGYIYNLDGVRHVPYRLTELTINPDWPVVVVEGEKDVHTLLEIFKGDRMLVTTNAGGAGRWRRSFGGFLACRRVAVIPDNDEPGLEHGSAVCASAILYGAKSVRIVRWPAWIAEGADITDWLAEFYGGHNVAVSVKRKAVLDLINDGDGYEIINRRAA
jgi:hypothetical protein